MAACNLLLLLLPWLAAAGTAAVPGCKIRITAKGLELVKQEGLRFVEQELENISIPDLHGKEGQFHYNNSGVRVTELDLALSSLHFQPQQHLAFAISNASISLRFRRQLLYWFFYDVGSINASADGVNIRTVLRLSKDAAGRLKISNITCNASIARMQTGFTGTLRKVYEFLSTFITPGLRFLLNRKICPALNYAGLVHLNSLLDTVPGAEPGGRLHRHRLLPAQRPPRLRGHPRPGLQGDVLPPLVQRDGGEPGCGPGDPGDGPHGLRGFLRALLQLSHGGLLPGWGAEQGAHGRGGAQGPGGFAESLVPGQHHHAEPAVVDAPLKLVLQVLTPPVCTIRPSGTFISVSATLNISLVPANHSEIPLSSMTMEAKLNAKVSLRGKALQVHLDLRRFRIYSKQSILESLALFPLQTPLKTLLQLAIMPMLNAKTKKGVPIPLPEGMDFTEEVVTSHLGFITVGADLHFSKGLREVIEKYQPARRLQSPGPTAPPL